MFIKHSAPSLGINTLYYDKTQKYDVENMSVIVANSISIILISIESKKKAFCGVNGTFPWL